MLLLLVKILEKSTSSGVDRINTLIETIMIVTTTPGSLESMTMGRCTGVWSFQAVHQRVQYKDLTFVQACTICKTIKELQLSSTLSHQVGDKDQKSTISTISCSCEWRIRETWRSLWQSRLATMCLDFLRIWSWTKTELSTWVECTEGSIPRGKKYWPPTTTIWIRSWRGLTSVSPQLVKGLANMSQSAFSKAR